MNSPKDNEKHQGPQTLSLTYQATALQYSGLDCQQKPAEMFLRVCLCVHWGSLVT